MKKSEIKMQVNGIMELIKNAREEEEKILNPWYEIVELLNKIENIEEDNMIDTNIYFDTVKDDTIQSCIDNSYEIEQIFDSFETLISDLECWQEEVSESKSDEIQENYIDILNEIKENFDLQSIQDEEDFDNYLFNMYNQLEEMDI